MLKWLVVAAAIVILLIGGYVIHGKYIGNPRVIEEIRSNPDGDRAGIVMLLTLPDGAEIPVNYLREGDKVFMGADGGWWRAFRDDGAAVSMLVRGETLTGHAVVILNDPSYTQQIFSRLRPTVPKWLPDWLNGKLVVVVLD